MTNLANQTVYIEDVISTENPAPTRLGQVTPLVEATAKSKAKVGAKEKQKKVRVLSREDQQIVMALNIVKHDLECLHNRYDQTTDPLLIDSITYELKAANMKYMYYLQLCKEKGIVSGL